MKLGVEAAKAKIPNAVLWNWVKLKIVKQRSRVFHK